MRVLLDTNIILDVLLDREPFVTDSAAIWAACDSARLVGVLPASTLTDIFTLHAEDGSCDSAGCRWSLPRSL